VTLHKALLVDPHHCKMQEKKGKEEEERKKKAEEVKK
jgi:hypothetical protein